ncbi:MAG: glycosyltransferase family 39 protein [Planctomycetota bacterium]
MKSVHIRMTALLLLITTVYLSLASMTMLWDRDEPRFGRAAVEMMHTGDYLVPRFDGQLRPDKPPLVYWLMVPWIKWQGATDLAVRIPSILASLVVALATFHMGRNLGGEVVGLRAAGLGALLPMPLLIGTAATADATMMAGVSLSMAVLVDRALHGSRPAHLPLLIFSLSWALLAKGPIGLVLFLLASVSASFAGKDVLDLGRKWWGVVAIACVVSVGIFLAWAIPANDATGGELARIGIGRHLIERSTSALESHGGSGLIGWILGLPFYLPVLLLGAAPISGLLVPIVIMRRSLFGVRGTGVLLAALVVPTLLLMTLIATKLPHYILACFPGLAVTVALAWSRVEEGKVEARKLAEAPGRIGRWLGATMLGLLAIAFAVVMVSYKGSMGTLITVVVAMLLTMVLTLRLKPGARFGNWQGPGFLSICTAVCMVLMLHGLGGLQHRMQVAPKVAELIEQSEASDAPLIVLGYDEPSLVFALDRDPLPGEKTVPSLHEQFPGGISQWIETAGPYWLLATVEELSKSAVDLQAEGCRLVWSTDPEGIVNYSNGETISLELWFLAES